MAASTGVPTSGRGNTMGSPPHHGRVLSCRLSNRVPPCNDLPPCNRQPNSSTRQRCVATKTCSTRHVDTFGRTCAASRPSSSASAALAAVLGYSFSAKAACGRAGRSSAAVLWHVLCGGIRGARCGHSKHGPACTRAQLVRGQWCCRPNGWPNPCDATRASPSGPHLQLGQLALTKCLGCRALPLLVTRAAAGLHGLSGNTRK